MGTPGQVHAPPFVSRLFPWQRIKPQKARRDTEKYDPQIAPINLDSGLRKSKKEVSNHGFLGFH